MGSRWDEFSKIEREGLLSLKPRMTITIYGSYHPSSELDRLYSLKAFLISDGYTDTKLVKDYPRRSDEDELMVSTRCLDFSDLNLFVLTHEGMRHGAVREISYITQSHNPIELGSHTKVFEEVVGGKSMSAIPPLTQEDIRIANIEITEFSNDDQLHEFARAKAYLFLRALSHVLKRRPSI